ncbi:MAG TPA: type VI secretion system contractile sheath large subunit, partial [Pyrinomonadaceae bacterium]|nr:type VI secretion system contractile sheath large subunit [Pyrinomonadaceae bacterium]
MAKQQDTAGTQVLETTTQEGSLLDKILTDGKLARDDYQKERAKDMIGEFVNQVMSGQLTLSKNMDVAINSRIAEIDRLLSAQMNEIMHQEDFQKLQASWRGLHHLVKNSLTGTMLKIRVMNVTKKELLKDFERALEFDQSTIFKKIYEDEYGTFGGAPFGALIGDYEFGNHPQDMALLDKIAGVAA